MRKIVLAFLGLLLAAPVYAQARNRVACGDYEDIVGQLTAEKYQEATHARALANDGQLVEIFTSPDNSTWTLLAINPETKKTCVVAAGEEWQDIPREPTEQEEPSL